MGIIPGYNNGFEAFQWIVLNVGCMNIGDRFYLMKQIFIADHDLLLVPLLDTVKFQ